VPQVIAELCQNFNGDKALLKDMIWAAAGSGADYVKVQGIFSNELTHRPRFDTGLIEGGEVRVIKRPYEAELERLKTLELDPHDYEWVAAQCLDAGATPMVTLFSRAQVPLFADLGFREVKIASYDCGSFPLIQEAAATYERIIISTGATWDWEIEKTAEILSGLDFSLLHCVSIYPTPLGELHLSRMEHLRRYAASVGFSDHSRREEGARAAALAMLLGADVIERHFSLLDATSTKDGPVSIDPETLKQTCELAHGSPEEIKAFVQEEIGDFEHAIGCETRCLSHQELLNRDYYRGRFASRDGENHIFNWEDRPVERWTPSQ
jgi:N,N'-diacetyllegionaminate synthase